MYSSTMLLPLTNTSVYCANRYYIVVTLPSYIDILIYTGLLSSIPSSIACTLPNYIAQSYSLYCIHPTSTYFPNLTSLYYLNLNPLYCPRATSLYYPPPPPTLFRSSIAEICYPRIGGTTTSTLPTYRGSYIFIDIIRTIYIYYIFVFPRYIIK